MSCKDHGVKTPDFIVEDNWFTIVFHRPVEKENVLTEQVEKLIRQIGDQTLSGIDIMSSLELKHRPTFLYNYLQPALQAGLIEMIIPEKPRSRMQKCRLSKTGIAFIADMKH